MMLNNENGNRRRRLSELEVTPELNAPFVVDDQPTRTEAEQDTPHAPPAEFATRTMGKQLAGMDKSKLLLLGGGLAAAVLFFVFTALVGKSPRKTTIATPAQQGKQETIQQTNGSVTPLMEPVRNPAPEDSGGQLGPNDIRRTRSSESKVPGTMNAVSASKQVPAKSTAVASLGLVPSFADTQQKWEEPQPYGAATAANPQQPQQQNGLKEPSLVFVRSQVQNQAVGAVRADTTADTLPILDMAPGSRIQAKLQTQISSALQAPVVAIVEYTYAIGDRVIVPAGARVYGQLQQADPSGLVGVKFDEIELLDGAREKIEAIGTDLDLGPIKGEVSGKNTGKNFLVRGAAGVGSILAEVAGNKNSAAFSESDMLRERMAQNIGTAGDSEIMNLNAKSRIVVSVPADTKIYIVFTKHEGSSTELRRVASAKP